MPGSRLLGARAQFVAVPIGDGRDRRLSAVADLLGNCGMRSRPRYDVIIHGVRPRLPPVGRCGPGSSALSVRGSSANEVRSWLRVVATARGTTVRIRRTVHARAAASVPGPPMSPFPTKRLNVRSTRNSLPFDARHIAGSRVRAFDLPDEVTGDTSNSVFYARSQTPRPPLSDEVCFPELSGKQKFKVYSPVYRP